MNDADPDAARDLWPAPPPALTLRGVLIALGIGVFAVAMTIASIAMRRTNSERTTQLFGTPTIHALQHGRQLAIELPADSPLLAEDYDSGSSDVARRTDLTGSPGHGHFRHALLEDKHYDWATEQPIPVREVPVKEPEWVTVEIAGPPANVTPVRIELELSEGWVGPADEPRSVRVHERVRVALRNFIDTRKDISGTRAP